MKFLLKALILLSSLYIPPVAAQQQDITDLVNTVRKDAVPDSFRYFYLEDTAYARQLHQFVTDHKVAMVHILKIEPGFTGKTDDDYAADSSTILWSSLGIAGAVFIPNQACDSVSDNRRIIHFIDKEFYSQHKDSLDTVLPWNEIYAPVNKKLSRKKKEQAAACYSDSLALAIPAERSRCFHFTIPEFTKDLRYAFIEVGDGRMNTVYLYRKLNGRWEMVCPVFEWG